MEEKMLEKIETLENAVCALSDAILTLCDIQENPDNYMPTKWISAYRLARAVKCTYEK